MGPPPTVQVHAVEGGGGPVDVGLWDQNGALHLHLQQQRGKVMGAAAAGGEESRGECFEIINGPLNAPQLSRGEAWKSWLLGNPDMDCKHPIGSGLGGRSRENNSESRGSAPKDAAILASIC